jgi:hypothetical protein
MKKIASISTALCVLGFVFCEKTAARDITATIDIGLKVNDKEPELDIRPEYNAIQLMANFDYTKQKWIISPRATDIVKTNNRIEIPFVAKQGVLEGLKVKIDSSELYLTNTASGSTTSHIPYRIYSYYVDDGLNNGVITTTDQVITRDSDDNNDYNEINLCSIEFLGMDNNGAVVEGYGSNELTPGDIYSGNFTLTFTPKDTSSEGT